MSNQKSVEYDTLISTSQLTPIFDLFYPDKAKTGNPLWHFSSEITARKQGEEELSLLAESLPQMVWITRPDGFADYFNQRWYDYTGLTYAQVQGDGWSESIHLYRGVH